MLSIGLLDGKFSVMDLISEFKQSALKLIETLNSNLNSIRTNRVSPAIVENIYVETYGGKAKLKMVELATIINEGPQTLVLIPFDITTISDIEKAILKSPLNISPQVKENKIVLTFPPLTEEQRSKLIKLINQLIEEKKQELRNLRDLIRKKLKNLLENKQITEDEKFSLEKKIDEETKEINNRLLLLKERKEKEIMII